jgi:hypothetical protein
MANCSKLAFGRQLEGSPGRPAFFRLRGLGLPLDRTTLGNIG